MWEQYRRYFSFCLAKTLNHFEHKRPHFEEETSLLALQHSQKIIGTLGTLIQALKSLNGDYGFTARLVPFSSHDLKVPSSQVLQISAFETISGSISSIVLTMPTSAHPWTWLANVIVPLVRWLWRMDKYWLKVEVPSMDGASERTTS